MQTRRVAAEAAAQPLISGVSEGALAGGASVGGTDSALVFSKRVFSKMVFSKRDILYGA